MKKTLIGLLAATTVAVPLTFAAPAIAAPAPTSTASAVAAASTVPYTGQGVTNGVLNNDVGGGTGYLLWVFNVKGATNVQLHLPGGETVPMVASGNGYKYQSDFFRIADLGKAFVTYTGTAKNPVLTISHGHGVDSNVPLTPVYDAITGGTVPGDADDVFGYHKQHTYTYTWTCTDGAEHSGVTHYGYDFDVDATAILGDYTGQVVGWTLGGTSNPVTNRIGYTGAERGTCTDGASFDTWTYNGSPTPYPIPVQGGARSGLTVNDAWLNGGETIVRDFDRMQVQQPLAG